MALAFPVPAWGGPSASGMRRAWAPPSCGMPHSDQHGDRNLADTEETYVFTTSDNPAWINRLSRGWVA